MKFSILKLEQRLTILNLAVEKNRSKPYCLRLWSNFIRLRDGYHCVLCGSNKSIAAHHIFRKSFLKRTQFQTGNGISLCRECHKQPHEGFNRIANLDLPMDAEGGENIDLATFFLKRLILNGKNQNLLGDEFYFFSDDVLEIFKAFQGFNPETQFVGTRIEQAYQIWNASSPIMMKAVLEANGFTLPHNFVQYGNSTTYFTKDTGSEHGLDLQ